MSLAIQTRDNEAGSIFRLVCVYLSGQNRIEFFFKIRPPIVRWLFGSHSRSQGGRYGRCHERHRCCVFSSPLCFNFEVSTNKTVCIWRWTCGHVIALIVRISDNICPLLRSEVRDSSSINRNRSVFLQVLL